MVEVVDLHKKGRLSGVNLRLDSGSLALLGPNGAGKSTLLSLLAGRIRPDGGVVRLFGQDPRSPGAARARAYIPQHLSFPPTLRVEEIMEAARRLKGATPRDKDEAILRMGLEGHLKRPVAQLSGGWRQRLALATGLMGYPLLWLLDEPASALDGEGLERLQDWLAAHLAMGGLAILSAHRQEELSRLAERYVRLENGRVVDQGSVNYAQEPS
ncbi:MAG: ABC transporter ATP-binding protein [Meiothermus sp.]|uniref:ATP-binding cassette domain-containing protein n=1 Tax=Meiothermus sp. TaxID=1955249 RepID=UPI0025E6DF52|nr:ABC transporter ATP-binding protein [Meiothermus sp.]MCS7194074.1 ABC transporter ATP-binding protein [Meiothermus sp.]MDW8091151.1 ABC transporter ATP-binding protein [Meiothermus sp.]MDW8480473.1 ABC transporter ATP-binding protein [Meiothermus sp.]